MTTIHVGARAAVAAGLAVSILMGGALLADPVMADAPADRTVREAARPSAYSAPVNDPVDVVRGFEAPPARWAAGHRGVNLVPSEGAPVLAPADGVVTFAGPVAGRAVIVLTHQDGLRSSLEPVVSTVAVGEVVTKGQVIGVLDGAPTHCTPRRCLHWGVRDGDTYLDPMTLLAVHGPVVLLPLGG